MKRVVGNQLRSSGARDLGRTRRNQAKPLQDRNSRRSLQLALSYALWSRFPTPPPGTSSSSPPALHPSLSRPYPHSLPVRSLCFIQAAGTQMNVQFRASPDRTSRGRSRGYTSSGAVWRHIAKPTAASHARLVPTPDLFWTSPSPSPASSIHPHSTHDRPYRKPSTPP